MQGVRSSLVVEKGPDVPVATAVACTTQDVTGYGMRRRPGGGAVRLRARAHQCDKAAEGSAQLQTDGESRATWAGRGATGRYRRGARLLGTVSQDGPIAGTGVGDGAIDSGGTAASSNGSTADASRASGQRSSQAVSMDRARGLASDTAGAVCADTVSVAGGAGGGGNSSGGKSHRSLLRWFTSVGQLRGQPFESRMDLAA